MQKWGSLNDLADASGMSVRNLQYIRKQEPNVLVWRQVGKRVEYDIPACNTNLRRRERELALREAEPQDIAEAERRKAIADARLAELKLAREEQKVVEIEESVRVVAKLLTQLRAMLLTLPQRWAPMIVGLKTIQEATAKLDAMVREALTALSEGDADAKDAAA